MLPEGSKNDFEPTIQKNCVIPPQVIKYEILSSGSRMNFLVFFDFYCSLFLILMKFE